MEKKISTKHLRYTIVGMIGLFLSYRLLFMLLFCKSLTLNDYFEIFSRGLLYDYFIIGLSFLPISVLSIINCSTRKYKTLLTKCIISYIFILLSFTISFFLISIIHYNYLHRLITINSITHINDFKCVINMLIQHKGLSILMIIIIINVVGSIIFIVHIAKTHYDINKSITYRFSFGLLCLCLLGLFIRTSNLNGKIIFLQIGDAYYSQYMEQNEAILNPLFILYKTTIDYKANQNIPIIDYRIFEKNIQRNNNYYKTHHFKNVVLIIMEGMQSSFGKDTTLTPFLNKLKSQSFYFTEAYSSGVHTAHAVFSIITSLPSQCSHPFLGHIPRKYSFSLASELKHNGFDTFFMMPHDIRFDNMEGFLLLNGFDKVFSLSDYPKNEIVNAFGINDHSLLEHAIQQIDKKTKKHPVFCTILTVSNHIPYTLPETFPKNSIEREYRIIQYADWALSDFYNKVKNKEWYKETLFVLVGDHAREYSGEGIFEIDNHHIELIIHDPKSLSRSICNNIAGHVDIAPTILGYLGIHKNPCQYGIDLNKYRRDYLLMSSDEAVECINDSMYCKIINKDDIYVENKNTHIRNNRHNDSIIYHIFRYLE